MRHSAFAVAMLLGLAGPAVADPAEGIWQTARDDNGKFGHIQIAPCGDRICGVLVRAFDENGKEYASPNIGKNIIWDMEARGDGEYRGGKIWAPDRDKIYNSRMTIQGDTIAVSGCVIGFCRDGGRWRRVK